MCVCVCVCVRARAFLCVCMHACKKVLQSFLMKNLLYSKTMILGFLLPLMKQYTLKMDIIRCYLLSKSKVLKLLPMKIVGL